MKIVINPTYEGLREWITQLPENFATQGEVIYDARNQIRLMQAPDGTPVYVKRFHKPAFLNRIAYTCLRTPKALRAYTNAFRLQTEGIGTPAPIAYILIYHHGLLAESYLITACSPLKRNMYEFRHHPLNGYEYIVTAFARFTAKLHDKGILHCDYSPGNILFDIRPDGTVDFELVDINRMRFNRPISPREGCKNLCRLWGKEDFFVLLAQEYAKARQMDISQCIRWTLHYWKQFWRFRK